MKHDKRKLLLFFLLSAVFWGVACLLMPAVLIGLCSNSVRNVFDCEVPIGAATFVVTALFYSALAVRFWRTRLSGME